MGIYFGVAYSTVLNAVMLLLTSVQMASLQMDSNSM